MVWDSNRGTPKNPNPFHFWGFQESKALNAPNPTIHLPTKPCRDSGWNSPGRFGFWFRPLCLGWKQHRWTSQFLEGWPRGVFFGRCIQVKVTFKNQRTRFFMWRNGWCDVGKRVIFLKTPPFFWDMYIWIDIHLFLLVTKPTRMKSYEIVTKAELIWLSIWCSWNPCNLLQISWNFVRSSQPWKMTVINIDVWKMRPGVCMRCKKAVAVLVSSLGLWKFVGSRADGWMPRGKTKESSGNVTLFVCKQRENGEKIGDKRQSSRRFHVWMLSWWHSAALSF